MMASTPANMFISSTPTPLDALVPAAELSTSLGKKKKKITTLSSSSAAGADKAVDDKNITKNKEEKTAHADSKKPKSGARPTRRPRTSSSAAAATTQISGALSSDDAALTRGAPVVTPTETTSTTVPKDPEPQGPTTPTDGSVNSSQRPNVIETKLAFHGDRVAGDDNAQVLNVEDDDDNCSTDSEDRAQTKQNKGDHIHDDSSSSSGNNSSDDDDAEMDDEEYAIALREELEALQKQLLEAREARVETIERVRQLTIEQTSLQTQIQSRQRRLQLVMDVTQWEQVVSQKQQAYQEAELKFQSLTVQVKELQETLQQLESPGSLREKSSPAVPGHDEGAPLTASSTPAISPLLSPTEDPSSPARASPPAATGPNAATPSSRQLSQPQKGASSLSSILQLQHQVRGRAATRLLMATSKQQRSSSSHSVSSQKSQASTSVSGTPRSRSLSRGRAAGGRLRSSRVVAAASRRVYNTPTIKATTPDAAALGSVTVS
jgi:hypothetical protein